MKGTLIDNRYTLLAPIGSGGEARVFLARDNATRQEVALRMALKPALDTSSITLPAAHEGWVRLLNRGFDHHYGAYHVLELLQGGTLSQMVQVAPLEPAAWLTFVTQSLEAVEALHVTGAIHGDLNADNFFHTNEPDSRWKLLELPFLRFDPPEARSNLFGSIHTLAPELLGGAMADVRTDLYSLGCLYYYAASGVYPQTGFTPQDIAIGCLRFAPPPLLEKAPLLPHDWCSWVMTFLSREPQNRFASAAAAHHLLGVA